MTRAEAITILETMKNGTTYGSYVCEAFDMSIKALEQPESRWIPCAERLPEPDEAVLVSTKFGMCVAWTTDDSGNIWLTEVLVFCGDEVFAWMPLPATYKKGEADDKK